MKVKVRKATMTNKERIEALLRRERPDRVPFWAGGRSFAANYMGVPLADRYTKPKVMYEAERKTCHDFDWVFAPTILSRQNRGVFGGEVKLPTNKYSQGSYVTKYADDTTEEVMVLKIPHVKACFTPEMLDFYQ